MVLLVWFGCEMGIVVNKGFINVRFINVCLDKILSD
jgi:hypothetical protein